MVVCLEWVATVVSCHCWSRASPQTRRGGGGRVGSVAAPSCLFGEENRPSSSFSLRHFHCQTVDNLQNIGRYWLRKPREHQAAEALDGTTTARRLTSRLKTDTDFTSSPPGSFLRLYRMPQENRSVLHTVQTRQTTRTTSPPFVQCHRHQDHCQKSCQVGRRETWTRGEKTSNHHHRAGFIPRPPQPRLYPESEVGGLETTSTPRTCISLAVPPTKRRQEILRPYKLTDSYAQTVKRVSHLTTPLSLLLFFLLLLQERRQEVNPLVPCH